MKLDEYFGHWEEVRAGLLGILDGFKPNDLIFQPFKCAWSVCRISLHIANTEDGWIRYVIQSKTEGWPEWPAWESLADVTSIKSYLDEVHAYTLTCLRTLDQNQLMQVIETPWGEKLHLGWIIWHVLEHEIHHRGELSLILGLLGREGLDV